MSFRQMPHIEQLGGWKNIITTMAGNFGKFIDRSPIICAVRLKNFHKSCNYKDIVFQAGKPSGDRTNPTVASTLKEYSLEDKITAIKHDAKIWNEDVFVPPLKPPPIRNPEFKGLQTEVFL